MEKQALNLAESANERQVSFPALRALGLEEEDLAIVERNGYLQQDYRLDGRVGYWRLRFRQGGRLRTIYLGREARRVAVVKRELRMLQVRRTRRNKQARAVRRGRKIVRRAKARLALILEHHGYHFHGDVIRKLRKSPAPTNTQEGGHEDGDS